MPIIGILMELGYIQRVFRQLIIILYYDKTSKKRYPGLYALINNKTFEGYLELFKKILSIITIENSKSLKLKSYTTDFEQALINCLSILIPNVSQLGAIITIVLIFIKMQKNTI